MTTLARAKNPENYSRYYTSLYVLELTDVNPVPKLASSLLLPFPSFGQGSERSTRVLCRRLICTSRVGGCAALSVLNLNRMLDEET